MADAPDDEVRAALEKAIGFQYDILRLLGRGGMGAVYHAHERALDRAVAIKVLPPDVAATDTARERFLREARTAARLTHPNIVPLFTFGETGGLIYYVMGYVEGESLQQRLDRAGKLDPANATRMLNQLASALDYAHAQGIVHRDVKPDNILIERGTGDAKLTDFGIAKRATDGATLTGIGLLLGTPRYMSPEQASGDRDVDPRSDIYALGLVGYAMLTGRPPFDGANVQDVLRQQVMREAPSLRKLMPDAPSSLVVSVERALKKDPKERWQSASTMAAALADDEEGDGVTRLGEAGRRPGVYAITMIGVTFFMWNTAWFFGTKSVWLLSCLCGLMPLGAVIDYLVARYRDKKSALEIKRMFTQPPKWWQYWWPERWRRSDDVWSRLPRQLQEIRTIASLGIGLGLFTLQGIFLVLTAVLPGRIPLAWRGAFEGGLIFGLIGSVSLIGWAAIRGQRWGRKHGLSSLEAAYVTSEPTAKLKFWTRPEFARLLSASEPIAGEPRTHAELAEAIAGAVRQLPDHHEASDAARRLALAIDALDGEIARLTHEADPAEVARLEKRLEAPGNEEMRKLYASQLTLMRRLEQQRGDAEARRTRYSELLRTLWLQVASLRAQAAADSAQETDISGRIRALCRSVENEVHGMREAAEIARAR